MYVFLAAEDCEVPQDPLQVQRTYYRDCQASFQFHLRSSANYTLAMSQEDRRGFPRKEIAAGNHTNQSMLEYQQRMVKRWGVQVIEEVRGGYKPRDWTPTDTALDIAYFLSTMQEKVWILAYNPECKKANGDIDLDSQEPTLSLLKTPKDILTLAHALNTCPVGKHLTVYLRRDRIPAGYIAANHGTTWEHFKQIVAANFELRPRLGTAWQALLKKFDLRIPMVYYSLIFEEYEHDPEVQAQSMLH